MKVTVKFEDGSCRKGQETFTDEVAFDIFIDALMEDSISRIESIEVGGTEWQRA